MLRLLKLLTFDVYDREEQEMIARAPGPESSGDTKGLPTWVFFALAIGVIAVIASKTL